MVQTLNKMMQTMGKESLYKIQDNKDQLLLELTNKANEMENLNKQKIIENNTKEQEYLGKIEELEQKLLSSEKCDYILLHKQNKKYELELNNLNKKYQGLGIKYEEDTKRFKYLSKDLTSLKEQIIQELNYLEELRNTITNIKLKKEKSPVNKHKIEMVMKYKDLPENNFYDKYIQPKEDIARFSNLL
jgi:hypothetical protein